MDARGATGAPAPSRVRGLPCFFPTTTSYPMEDKKPALLYGINPVTEALRAGKRTCHKIIASRSRPVAKGRP